MSKVIILSSTPRSNLNLAKKIAEVADELSMETEIFELESMNLPLYTIDVEKNGIPQAVIDLAKKLALVSGFVFVAPEYNGGLPPVSVNLLNWLSRTGADWRAAFDRKMVLMASCSGGGGANLLRVMNTQFQHLGAIVLPRAVMVNSGKEFNKDAALQGLESIKRWDKGRN
jgi:chromate reductase